MQVSLKIPFYAKAALIFISVFAFVFALQLGQDIVIPIIYAALIAILLNPVVNYLMRKRIPKVISILIVVTLAICVVLGIIYIVTSQLSMFSETYPQLKEKFNTTSHQVMQWVSQKFKINQSRINEWIQDAQKEAVANLAIAERLTQAGKVIFILLLVPVYLFMILYYKPLLLEFIRKVFRSEHHATVTEVLDSSKIIIQSYLVGLCLELVIMAVLNSVGLLLIGVDYAIILGIIGALLNIIPYIGGIIAIALPMIIAFVTRDSLLYPALVLIVYLFIQFIDNNYLVPNIVASRVKLNALVSVVVVLVGGALFGIPGMFLSIPLTAILKVIFDHIEPLKPWGFLLGNDDLANNKKNLSVQKTNPVPQNAN